MVNVERKSLLKDIHKLRIFGLSIKNFGCCVKGWKALAWALGKHQNIFVSYFFGFNQQRRDHVWLRWRMRRTKRRRSSKNSDECFCSGECCSWRVIEQCLCANIFCSDSWQTISQLVKVLICLISHPREHERELFFISLWLIWKWGGSMNVNHNVT